MKILHGMTDVAGQGTYSVKGLRKNGLNAELVVWEGNGFAYTDYKSLHVSRKPWLLPLSLCKIAVFALRAVFQYDVFHFHFSRSLLPYNADLPVLKWMKKRVFMEYHGSDIRWCYYRKMPRYWPTATLGSPNRRAGTATQRIDRYVDGYILHDAELRKHLPPQSTKPVYYLPLRVDVDRLRPVYPRVDVKRPVIIHAPSNSLYKGTKYVEEAVEKLKEQYDFDYIRVENTPQNEALKIFSTADIILDQFFAGTYGVFAVEAMAMGKPVICYLTEEMEEEFPPDLPIQNANIDNIYQQLEALIQNPVLCHELGIRGRAYAENYHDYTLVTRGMQEVYAGTYKPKTQREAFAYIRSLKEG